MDLAAAARWRHAALQRSGSARWRSAAVRFAQPQWRRLVGSEAATELPSATCSQCGKKSRGWIFCCEACRMPMKLHAQGLGNCNYFALLGVPEKYDLEVPSLEARYKQLQKLVHPDRFPNASPEIRDVAEQNSALISNAYKTLKDPISRAKHLMEAVHRVTVLATSREDEEDEDFGSWGSGQPGRVQNQELLLDILEINDEIDEAKGLPEIQRIRERCSRVTAEAQVALGKALAAELWDAARSELETLQMYSRVQHRLLNWEFGDVHAEMMREAYREPPKPV